MGHWEQTEGKQTFRLTRSEADFLSVKIAMLLEADTRLRGKARKDLELLTELMSKPPALRRPKQRKPSSNSGPVTVTQPDGTVTTQRALTAKELRRMAPERLPITPDMRARVLHRDMQTCRYCQTTIGPWEIDHVLPVAQGGHTRLFNLVTSCQECNRRKGNQIWRPVPLVTIKNRARRAS